MCTLKVCDYCSSEFTLSDRSPTTRRFCYNCHPINAKDKGKRVKKKIKVRELMESLKTECFLCGYNKCKAALHFHHKDPSQKEHAISVLVGYGKATKAKAESLKCVVLCANCHAEAHEFNYKFD